MWGAAGSEIGDHLLREYLFRKQSSKRKHQPEKDHRIQEGKKGVLFFLKTYTLLCIRDFLLAIFYALSSIYNLFIFYGVSLGGKNDHIEIPDHTSLNPSDEITIEAWYMPGSFYGTGNDPIIDKAYQSHSSPYYQYHLDVTGDQYDHQCKGSFLFMASIDGKLCNARTLGSLWQPGKWYFVAGTYDGHTMNIYVNGEDKTSRFYVGDMSKSNSSVSGRLDNYGKQIRLGKFVNTNKCLPGIIDEVKIYDRALSAATIKKQVRITFSPMTLRLTILYQGGLSGLILMKQQRL